MFHYGKAGSPRLFPPTYSFLSSCARLAPALRSGILLASQNCATLRYVLKFCDGAVVLGWVFGCTQLMDCPGSSWLTPHLSETVWANR